MLGISVSSRLYPSLALLRALMPQGVSSHGPCPIGAPFISSCKKSPRYGCRTSGVRPSKSLHVNPEGARRVE